MYKRISEYYVWFGGLPEVRVQLSVSLFVHLDDDNPMKRYLSYKTSDSPFPSSVG